MAAEHARWPRSLALVGVGHMGGALLRGWLAHGFDPSRIHAMDSDLDPAIAAVCERHGVVCQRPSEPPEVLVLAVKPQTFAGDPSAFADLAGPGTLVVSILAGQTLANLRVGFPAAGAIVRAMPNLPASVGRGMTALAASPDLSGERRATSRTLLAAVGQVEWLDESLLDAVTAVSGSGPAYVFLLTEALAAAGEGAGLSPETAARLARATVEGASELMASQPTRTPTAFRQSVASPGGTTEAALKVLLASDGLAPLLGKAVEAAKRRAAELGS